MGQSLVHMQKGKKKEKEKGKGKPSRAQISSCCSIHQNLLFADSHQ
jgi:hypothetical protein